MSDRSPTADTEERYGLMPPVPATHGPHGPVTATTGGTGTTTIAQASVLRLERFRDVPAFMSAALGLRRAFADSPGAITMSLRAAPLRRTFWTLSHWRSDADLHAFVGRPAHRDVMARFGPAMRSADFVTWDVVDLSPPTWNDAARHLTEDRTQRRRGSPRRAGGGPQPVELER